MPSARSVRARASPRNYRAGLGPPLFFLPTQVGQGPPYGVRIETLRSSRALARLRASRDNDASIARTRHETLFLARHVRARRSHRADLDRQAVRHPEGLARRTPAAGVPQAES